MDEVNKDNQAGKLTEDQYIELVRGCCLLSGGKWNDKLSQCEAPAAQQAPTRPEVAPPLEGATENPPPPLPPIRNPGATESFTPGPIG